MTDPGKAVFLSYASQDTEAARNLCNALRAAGIEVWFDQSELRGGDVWDASIRRQIKNCALFIPVISQNTHTRGEGYFRLEWKLAVDRSHLMASDLPFLLPVVVDDIPDGEDRVPDRFREVQWTRLPGGASADAFVKRVRHLLAPDARIPNATIAGSSAVPASSIGGALIRSKPPVFRSFVPWIVIGLAVLATSYFATDKFVASKRAPPAAESPATGPASAGVPEKSVAVLPFVDMSERHDQEYFSDGLSEELIDHLAHAADLKVIARTSSFQFKGKSDDMRTIGHKLGVANLLEGSVRTSGSAIRVTAQLINVIDGTHRWSETYDRQMGDVFKLQDDIAGAVVAALKATMAARLPSLQVRSASIDSYNEVLRGRYFNNRVTKEDSLRGIAAFDQAIKLDPENGEAWAGLARAYNIRGLNGWMPPREAYVDAREAVDRALALNPNLALAHSILGALEWNYAHDFESSRREYHRSMELDPSLTESSLSDGIDAFAAGQPDRAVLSFKRAKEVNPLDAFTLMWLSLALYATDRLPEADRVDREILEISPGFAGIYCSRGEILLAQGQPGTALAMMNKETDEGNRLTCVPDALWALGQHKEADEMLAEAQRKFSHSQAYAIAFCYAFRHDNDSAFKWLDRSYDNREPEITMIKGFRELRTIRSDPRFAALLHKLNLPE